MDKQFNTFISITIIPYVVANIVEYEKMDEITAIDKFYNSKTYELLTTEDTKFWHYSSLMLYHIWKYEIDKNEILIPEVAYE